MKTHSTTGVIEEEIVITPNRSVRSRGLKTEEKRMKSGVVGEKFKNNRPASGVWQRETIWFHLNPAGGGEQEEENNKTQ